MKYDPVKEMDSAVRGLIKGMNFICLLMCAFIYFKTNIEFFGWATVFLAILHIYLIKTFKKDEKEDKENGRK